MCLLLCSSEFFPPCVFLRSLLVTYHILLSQLLLQFNNAFSVRQFMSHRIFLINIWDYGNTESSYHILEAKPAGNVVF